MNRRGSARRRQARRPGDAERVRKICSSLWVILLITVSTTGGSAARSGRSRRHQRARRSRSLPKAGSSAARSSGTTRSRPCSTTRHRRQRLFLGKDWSNAHELRGLPVEDGGLRQVRGTLMDRAARAQAGQRRAPSRRGRSGGRLCSRRRVPAVAEREGRGRWITPKGARRPVRWLRSSRGARNPLGCACTGGAAPTRPWRR